MDLAADNYRMNGSYCRPDSGSRKNIGYNHKSSTIPFNGNSCLHYYFANISSFLIYHSYYWHDSKDIISSNNEGAISAMAAGGGLALFGKIMGLNDFGLYGFFYQDLFSSLEAGYN